MKKTRIITFVNQKGGVGKTTSVVSVGSILASRGYDVLAVDLDGSANMTKYLCREAVSSSIYGALTSESPLPVVGVKEHLDIVPSSEKLYGIELALSQEVSRESILAEKLESVKECYDFILLDCPPHIGLMITSAFVASHDVVIVAEPEVMPIQGLATIMQYIDKVRHRLNSHIRLTGILITLYQRIKLHKTCEQTLRGALGHQVFETKIRKNCSLSEAVLEHQSIIDYAPSSNGAQDYEAFTDELLQRLECD